MFSKKKRSDIMRRIRSKETQAERIAFKYLRSKKIYFQKHYKRATGKPDIALPRKKRAVFIDGDFWHGRNRERLKKSVNSEYWVPKIEGNVKRDKKNRSALKKDGWQILRVWESDVKRKRTQQRELDKILEFLKAN